MRWKPARIWSIVITKLLEKENFYLVYCDDKAVGKWRIGKDGQETKKIKLLNTLMRPSEETGQQLAHGLFGFLMNTFNDHVDGLKHQLMVKVRHLYMKYFSHLGDISESHN